jgi:hypothetical protein
MAVLVQKSLGFITADALKRLKNQRCLGGMVTPRFKDEWKEKGDTIYVRDPGTFTTVDASSAISSYQTPSENSVAVALDKFRGVPIDLSLLDATYKVKDFNVQYADGALDAISDYVDVQLATEMSKHIHWHSSTVGTTPTDASGYTEAKRWMAKGQTPPYGSGDRFAVLNEDAEARMLDQSLIVQAQQRGQSRSLLRGEIGEIYGYRTAMNQNIAKFTGGTLSASGTLQTNASGAAAATSLVFKASGTTLTGTITDGQPFSLDHGDTTGVRHYVATALATAAANTVTVSFYPALAADIAVSQTVTMPHGTDGTADVSADNLFFHRKHTILASAKIATPKTPNVTWATATDPVSGLSIMAVVGFDIDNVKDKMLYLTLFGIAHPRKGFGMRLFG